MDHWPASPSDGYICALESSFKSRNVKIVKYFPLIRPGAPSKINSIGTFFFYLFVSALHKIDSKIIPDEVEHKNAV